MIDRYDPGNSGKLLGLFLLFLLLAFAALIAAWIRGRSWGDLSSRRRCGEALSEDENRKLIRSRRSFMIWMSVSLICAVLAFTVLRR